MLSNEMETRALLGRNVTDSYGRNLGRVIGLEKNHFGELEAVQVEALAGQIVSAKTRQLSVTPKSVSLTPEWKLDANDLVQELSILLKRVSALEALRSSGEIGGEVYNELLSAQKTGYVEKLHSGRQLLESMSQRHAGITAQISTLTKYLANAKLDHKSGILDESSFKIAEQSLKPTLAPLIMEKADLASTMKQLETILVQ